MKNNICCHLDILSLHTAMARECCFFPSAWAIYRGTLCKDPNEQSLLMQMFTYDLSVRTLSRALRSVTLGSQTAANFDSSALGISATTRRRIRLADGWSKDFPNRVQLENHHCSANSVPPNFRLSTYKALSRGHRNLHAA
jgi:hypothetical protein